MRFLFSFALLFLLFSSAFAHRLSSFVHSASGHPSVWKQLTAVADDHPVRIAIAIKHKNADVLENLLNTVSDPRSPLYGDYLSFDEVNKLTSNAEATESVMKYLRQHGATNIEKTLTGDYVKATINAKQSEKLFSAPVYHFSHHDHPSMTVQRSLSYTIPHPIRDAVEFIGYLSHFPTVRSNKLLKTPNVNINTPGNTFPSLLNKVYNIDSNSVTNSAATQSCFESGQWISNSDINSFQSQYGLVVQNLAGISGPNYPGNCSDLNQCIESTLDFEYIMAVAQGAPTSYIGIDDADQQPFLDYAIALSNNANAPLVNSISYGEVEQQADPSVIQNFNTQVQKLGVRGITVVVASGDDGVANYPARTDLTKCGFYPSYPAVSPYVTAVGATQGPENSQTEVAETSNNGGGITSGGGFSTIFPTPSYQSSFVSSFLNTSTALPPTNAFNPSGRGYPDVAFLGHNYETVDNGQNIQGSGTSASAPVFAGMLTLINNARLSAGKSAVGFVNPALYQFAKTNPEIFHDVTAGENNCVAGDGTQCCTQGFTAQQGWDPVTGLGSVDFAALKKAFLALP